MSKLTLLDGGMGRELQRIGAPFSQPLWSAQALISAPEFVAQAHQNFIDAGAEIITVNSYACVPYHLGQELYVQQGQSLAEQAAAIARKVVDDNLTLNNRTIMVAGCIPPAFGSYRPDLFNSEQAKQIIADLYQAQLPYVDLWLAETIASLNELEVIMSYLRQSDKPSYYAFTLRDEVTEQAQLRSGELVTEAVTALCKTNTSAILFNCSVPEVMAQAVKDAKRVIEANDVEIKLGVYANNFAAISDEHEANNSLQTMRDCSADDYLAFAKEWHKLGASIIGGCCGIEPSHIAKLQAWRQQI